MAITFEKNSQLRFSESVVGVSIMGEGAGGKTRRSWYRHVQADFYEKDDETLLKAELHRRFLQKVLFFGRCWFSRIKNFYKNLFNKFLPKTRKTTVLFYAIPASATFYVLLCMQWNLLAEQWSIHSAYSEYDLQFVIFLYNSQNTVYSVTWVSIC